MLIFPIYLKVIEVTAAEQVFHAVSALDMIVLNPCDLHERQILMPLRDLPKSIPSKPINHCIP